MRSWAVGEREDDFGLAWPKVADGERRHRSSLTHAEGRREERVEIDQRPRRNREVKGQRKVKTRAGFGHRLSYHACGRDRDRRIWDIHCVSGEVDRRGQDQRGGPVKQCSPLTAWQRECEGLSRPFQAGWCDKKRIGDSVLLEHDGWDGLVVTERDAGISTYDVADAVYDL